MPSANKRKTICIFGNSHIACLKHALNQKLYATRKAIDFEFWGAAGKRFFKLDFVNGKIVPRNERVLSTVLAVNGMGKKVLDPSDYHAILFMGVGITPVKLFAPQLERIRTSKGVLSQAVFSHLCQDWLASHAFYRIARNIAQSSETRIFLAPSSFPCEIAARFRKGRYAGARKASIQEIDKIWLELETIAKRDGITLIRQPMETMSKGIMGSKAFCRVDVDGELSLSHNNPQYGALILKQLVDRCA